MPGRKPIPSKLKLLKGTDQPCRMRDDEPMPKSDQVEMPPMLSDEAKKQWALVVKQLKDADIITNLDVHALAMYCEVFARWQHANEQLSKYGAVIKTHNGYPAQSPYMQIAHKSFEQMKAMLVEFGMTPSSRTKVGVVGKTDVDPLDEFLSKRGR